MNLFIRIFVFGCIGTLLLLSCRNKTDLTNYFSCHSTSLFLSLETVEDFHKTFVVKLPKHWNTKLYYDAVQSEIFSADTLKELSDSFIMNFAMIKTPLQITEELRQKVLQKITEGNLKTEKEGFLKFQKKEAYAHLGAGKKKGLEYRIFQCYVKVDKENYMLLKAEFYGKVRFKKRFCEALFLMNKVIIHTET